MTQSDPLRVNQSEAKDLPGLVAGIDNLLRNCAGINAGQKLLLVGEAGDEAYYDADLCSAVKEVAEGYGVRTAVVHEIPGNDASDMSTALKKEMRSADVIILFSRLGDQTRFIESPGRGKKIMCYTLTKAHLSAPFATLDHRKMTRMLNLLASRIHSSSSYRIQTTDGTDLTGDIVANGQGAPTKEFTVELFPVMIFQPIVCHKLSGSLTVSNFVTSTSTQAYEQSVLMLDSAVSAHVEDSRITAFEGDIELVDRIELQLKRAAQLSGGDPYVLNSWHTGINPGTFFEGNPFDNLERWGTVAYGSPRYTHIHGAGKHPGDVAYNLIDATIWFDDELFWQDGRFVFLDDPDVQSMFNDEEQKILNSRFCLDIGI